MTQRAGKAVRGWAVVCVGASLTSIAASGQPTGPGLTIKDLQRVEQLHGDTGGLSKSLARGPASLAVPNDFSGVYQVPEDADSPYAGWYARVSGGLIAVFPRSEYVPGPAGMVATVSANTRYFLGSIPRSERPAAHTTGAKPLHESAIERVDRRADLARAGEQVRSRALRPDAPTPATVESAKDLAEVSAAIGKLCADPVYRANRLRELLARAEGVATNRE